MGSGDTLKRDISCVRFIGLRLSSHICLLIPYSLLPLGSLHKTAYDFLIYPACNMSHPSHSPLFHDLSNIRVCERVRIMKRLIVPCSTPPFTFSDLRPSSLFSSLPVNSQHNISILHRSPLVTVQSFTPWTL
jgi:hypothetical protein